MSKQLWKSGNMIYPLPVVLVTVSDGQGQDNVLTVAWTGTTCTNPACAYISVRPERYSYEMLTRTKEFVINLTTRELVKAVDYCGVRSGREEDKFLRTGLKKEEATHVSAPLIAQSPVNIECQVSQIIPLGSHDLFLAKVLAVHADKQYMDLEGRFDLAKADPIVYSHGEYYSLGEKLGTFGYSVKKGDSQ